MIDRVVVFVILLSLTALSYASVSIESYMVQEFNPSKGQTFLIPVKIDIAGDIKVHIYTPDGDLVRTLSGGKQVKAGLYKVAWEGKDSAKAVVPDEAYIPVVELATGDNGRSIVYDPRAISGGELISPKFNTAAQRQVHFQLDQPSRILARAGVKSGPMMKSIMNWQVRAKGRNIALWDGYDHDDLVNLYGHDKLTLLLTGFELPKHSIIVIGNKDKNYIAWRAEKNGHLSCQI